MKPTEWLEGIVIRSMDYLESDRIVGLLTPAYGRISAFGSGVRASRRRFGGNLDLFSHLKLEIRPPRGERGGLWRLSSVEMVEPHLGLRSRLEEFMQASYLAEVIGFLVAEQDPHAELFDWWKQTLGGLSRGEINREEWTRLDLDLLRMCGYAPRWAHCLECGREPLEERVFFSYEKGSVICPSCGKRNSGRFMSGEMRRRLAEGTPLVPADTDDLRHLVDEFVSFTAGRKIQTQRLREEMLSGRR